MRKRSSVKRPKLITGDQNMNANQLERLKRDQRELGHYLARVKKEGKTKLAYKLQSKLEYLSSTIDDLQEEYLTAA